MVEAEKVGAATEKTTAGDLPERFRREYLVNIRSSFAQESDQLSHLIGNPDFFSID